MSLRPLHVIGREMVPLLEALPESHMARWAGLAQARPLCTMTSASDYYGDDSGAYVIACLLGNITGWRGPDAKRIRQELKDHLATTKRK